MSKSPHPKVSKYQPIWDSLKSTGSCRITAPIIYHKTIIKQVQNKRDDDIAYRMDLADRNRKHRLTFKIDGTVITFKLVDFLTWRGL